jgi:hypothetical protein
MNRQNKNKKEVKIKDMSKANAKILSLCFISILVMLMLAVPACAQPGNLGHSFTYPAFSQMVYTPDYLLTGEPRVTVDAAGKEATIYFDTIYATPKARVYYGLYVPQQEIKVPQYRLDETEELTGKSTSHNVTIDLSKFENPKYNLCNFKENGGVICYRIELCNPDRATSTFYAGRFQVDEDCNLVPCITEGPFVNLVTTTSAIISWDTSEATTGAVEVCGRQYLDPNGSAIPHEIPIVGLSQNTTYEYEILIDGVKTPKTYQFKTAPTSANANFKFAFMTDSRTGVGGGERSFGGTNYHTLSRFIINAYNNGADFILFGGDLINGRTTNETDFRMQLKAWKDATEQVGCYVPIYEGMGNHEVLIDCYDDGSKYSEYGIAFDKRDDSTNKSAETVFAEEFVNPANSFPNPENPIAPSYSENVYYFDYANTRIISFNTHYWWCSNPEDFGGNLEGYVMKNQLEWIKNVLCDAKSNSSIKHIFMFAHTPAFPNGGHPQDSQWYNGGEIAKNEDYEGNPLDRTYVVDRRDELWEAISQNGKVVAVFFGHEHNYHRTSIDSETAVYLDGSSNSNFTNQVWQIVSGGAGAPFFAQQQEMPWSKSVECFYPGKHYCMIYVNGDEVRLKVVSDSDEIVDQCVLREGIPPISPRPP